MNCPNAGLAMSISHTKLWATKVGRIVFLPGLGFFVGYFAFTN
jgi:hypothetical protein